MSLNLNPIVYEIIKIKSAIDTNDFDKAREIITAIKSKQELSEYSEFLDKIIKKLDELMEKSKLKGFYKYK